ncbi:MAG: MFS transporter, partial [Actinobacteria bacterium]|nr:MFS transporter [Actinomycetota bacterium]
MGRVYHTRPQPITIDLPDPRPRSEQYPDYPPPITLNEDGPILDRAPPKPDPPPPPAPHRRPRRVVRTANTTRSAQGRDLFSHPRLWAHAVGISLWLVLYLTLAMYGQAMLVDSFGVSTAKASAIMSAFWVFDLVVLIAVGRISDRLQLRKPFALGGTLAAVLVIGYLAVLMGRASVSAGHLMLTGALLGASLAVAFGPWMANYSEDAEDADPRLQGTAWGIFGFLGRTMAVLVLLAVPRTVAATSWQTWLS